jgi:hypothetical protein
MPPTICSSVGILLSLVATVSAAISSTGETLVVNGINYFAAPTVMTKIDLSSNQLKTAATAASIDLIPLTVIGDSSNLFTNAAFTSIVNNFTASDDVFNTGFLQGKIHH